MKVSLAFALGLPVSFSLACSSLSLDGKDGGKSGGKEKSVTGGDDSAPPPSPEITVDEPVFINLTAHCSSGTEQSYVTDVSENASLVACVIKSEGGDVIEASDFEISVKVGGSDVKAELVQKQNTGASWHFAFRVAALSALESVSISFVPRRGDKVGERTTVSTETFDYDWKGDPKFTKSALALKVSQLPDNGGAVHNCAVLSDGTARCWGGNSTGRLGDNTTKNSLVPVVALSSAGTPLSDVSSISAGFTFTCAASAGQVYCAGENAYGQLGDGTTTDRKVFTPVPGLSGVKQVTAGHAHACALLESGEAKCWGYNGGGALGDNSTTARHIPITVLDASGSGSLKGIAQISAGSLLTCALMDDEAVLCWGNNEYGGVGDGTLTDRLIPVQVSGLGAGSKVTQIAAANAYYFNGTASYHFSAVCARKSDGTAWCWGRNSSGQLGDGTTTQRSAPGQVLRDDNDDGVSDGPLENVAQVYSGSLYSCALLLDGTARCWGNNSSGQLGDGTKTAHLFPVKVLDGGNVMSNIASLSLSSSWYSGSYYPTTLALFKDGTLKAWGDNSFGAIGDNTTTNRPEPVKVLIP